MAGLVPKEAQYGDKTALRQLGMKDSPITGTPELFNPQGGRPKGAVSQPGAQPLAPAAALGSETPLPPGGVSPEHQSLYDRGTKLAAAARVWLKLAESPFATPEVIQTAQALKEAARLAILDGREGTPFQKGL